MYCILLILCLVLQTSTQNCKSCATNVDRVLKQTLACKSNANKTVGLAVSIVKSNRVLFSRGYGIIDQVGKKPVTGDTVFQVASLSKAFACVLLVKMMEEKTKYTLDTKLKEILDKNDIFIDELRSNYATLRDLLAHRTGIPYNNEMRFDTKLKRSNVVERFKFLKPAGTFRGSYIYNNLMYGFLSYLAEVFGGDKWESMVKRYIFDPLGMTSSTFVTTADPEKIKLAQGYVEYYGELYPVSFDFTRQYGELCGSACILTTANDMTNWARFFLNGGKLPNGTRLISENAFKEITTPVNIIAHSYTDDYFSKPELPVTNIQNGYAHAWRVGFYRGYKMYVHTGSVWGYRAIISWYPDADLGIFLTFTGNDPNYLYRLSLHNYIFDAYRGFEPYLNSSTLCSFPEPWILAETPKRNPNHPKDLELQRNRTEYTGTYQNNAYGTLEVKGHHDPSKLTIEYGYASFLLYPSSTKDKFYGESTEISKYLFDVQEFHFSVNSEQVTLQTLGFGSKPIFEKQTETNAVHFYTASEILTTVLVILILIFQ